MNSVSPHIPAASAAPTRCWSCGGPVEATLFCPTCRAVQPPGDADPFTRLGFPRGFALDRAELDRRYFAAQRQLHPDRFATRSARERAISQSQAVSLNDAYETLKDPLARACAEGRIEVQGPRALQRDMPRWFARSKFADDNQISPD